MVCTLCCWEFSLSSRERDLYACSCLTQALALTVCGAKRQALKSVLYSISILKGCLWSHQRQCALSLILLLFVLFKTSLSVKSAVALCRGLSGHCVYLPGNNTGFSVAGCLSATPSAVGEVILLNFRGLFGPWPLCSRCHQGCQLMLVWRYTLLYEILE